MALNFYLDKIADYETMCWSTDQGGRSLTWVTETIVFGTMATGVPTLKDEATCRLFFERFVAHCIAAQIWKDAFDRLTFEDVVKHIGLGTNASAKTPAAFKKHLAAVVMDTTETIIRMRKS